MNQENSDEFFNQIKSRWSHFLDSLKQSNMKLFSMVNLSKPIALKNQMVTVQLAQPIQFFVEKLAEEQYQNAFNDALSAFYEKPMTFLLHDMSSQAIDVEVNSDSQNTNVEKTTQVNEEKPVETNNNEEKTLNEIITLFEGQFI